MQMRKSEFAVRKMGEAFFISESSLQKELNLEGDDYSRKVDIEGKIFLSLAELKQKGILDYIIIDECVKIILT